MVKSLSGSSCAAPGEAGRELPLRGLLVVVAPMAFSVLAARGSSEQTYVR